jgi:hypothetical protein
MWEQGFAEARMMELQQDCALESLTMSVCGRHARESLHIQADFVPAVAATEDLQRAAAG